jgi:hypothetical protein
MSVRCITAVLDNSQHASTELLMLVVLADYSDDDGNSYPSVASLARKCRLKPRRANYILTALQASGELRVLKNEGPKGTNRYRIMLSQLGASKPLHSSAPLQRSAPLHSSAPTPALQCAKPLHSSADEPSLNRQEPSDRARSARRTRTCPSSFAVTDDLKAWAAEKCPQVDIERETERFRNHEFEKPKSDWKAAWRNWMLNAIKFSGRINSSKQAFSEMDYRTGL